MSGRAVNSGGAKSLRMAGIISGKSSAIRPGPAISPARPCNHAASAAAAKLKPLGDQAGDQPGQHSPAPAKKGVPLVLITPRLSAATTVSALEQQHERAAAASRAARCARARLRRPKQPLELAHMRQHVARMKRGVQRASKVSASASSTQGARGAAPSNAATRAARRLQTKAGPIRRLGQGARARIGAYIGRPLQHDRGEVRGVFGDRIGGSAP